MNVLYENDHSKGAFYVEQDGQRKAEMTYTWAGTDRIIIDHTEVDDELRGQGVGYEMVFASVQFAREQQISIVPLCPFAKSVFNKYPEFKDVL
ncbi:MAG: GNAT family N-acetyltransferase [Rickettsiales bacterium]|nr:GNAT family N-acetyltransferase [Rickettsiales bacterium]